MAVLKEKSRVFAPDVSIVDGGKISSLSVAEEETLVTCSLFNDPLVPTQ